MDTTMNKHLLTIPEIVLTVGKLIPLWVQAHYKGEVVWYFRPKDLVAASAINRLFHTLLTPILWTVFAYPADNSLRHFLQSCVGPTRHFYAIPDDVIEKNSHHFRYLDLSLGDIIGGRPRRAEQLQLGCTRLQELRVSFRADAACVGRLFEANPGLRLLQWERFEYNTNTPPDPKFLFPLHQLRTLCLGGWKLSSVHLHHILSNNADTLEELELGRTTIIPRTPPMRPEWDALDLSAREYMSEAEFDEANRLMQGRPLLLPKVKSLKLNHVWGLSTKSMYSLVRAFPALEMLKIGYLEEETGLQLAKNLQEFCLNLRSIYCYDLEFHTDAGAPHHEDGMIHLVKACAPGNLIHTALTRWTFDDRLRDALLAHREGLETLELSFYNQETPEALKNVRKVIEGCKRLKKFSIFNFRRSYQFQDTSILLEGLKECPELESLTLVGFPFIETKLAVIGDEFDRITKYLREMENEAPPYEAVLSAGWRYSRKGVRGPNESASSEKFRAMAFETVASLPHVKTVILNCDRFEKD